VMYVDATNQHWPDLPGIILLGMAFGQLMLLSAWFVFVRWNIAMRVLIVIPAVFGLSLVAALATDGANEISQWFAILLVAFCTVAVPTTMVRFLRWQIHLEGQSRSATGMTVWQFSIWGLLSGTTAVAIVLGTARQVEMPLLVVGEAVAFFGCVALTGLFVFFVPMGIRRLHLAAIVTVSVVFVVCPLAGMLVGVTGLPPKEHPLQWALFGFCYGATIAIAVLALRIADYRLSRIPLATPAMEDTDAEDDASVDVMPSTKLPIKIQFPEVPDVAARHPSLSIHLPSEDD
ncbi:MAG: hypothetical protein QGG71_09125, partial [Pirellulaceae bacterium]|nr:hypothetical protein [Pirellulaceae bacterium]